MDRCAAIGYGFLPFSFSSLGELEADEVTLLKRIRKFSITQDIRARAAAHIFNKISFTIAKGVRAQLWYSAGHAAPREGFVKGTIPRPPVVPIPPTTAVVNAVNIELWETCNNLTQLETRMKCVWEELDSMTVLPRLITITPEMSVFLSAVEKQKEEQRLFQFLNGLDESYSAQRSQLLLINPLPSVKNACAEDTKGKCSICGFKWHPLEKCWEKVGYPVWHHKYKQSQSQNKQSQSRSRSSSNGSGGNYKKTATSASSGSSSFTFTSEQFETLMRSVINDIKNNRDAGNDY
ncbi:hypothetical protein Tco_0114954 [Tanacetum coccineum]